jgi:cyanate permease
VAGIFTTSLALPVDIAARHSVGAATGVVLSIGYGLAAFGPLGAGALHDLTGTYASSMLALVICAVLLLVGGIILPETHPSRRAA